MKACKPNLLQKKERKNNRANKSTEKKNGVVVTVQGGNTYPTLSSSVLLAVLALWFEINSLKMHHILPDNLQFILM